MGRLKPELLGRIETFSHRMADVADALISEKRSIRVTDQIYGCGTSGGANSFEADEAATRREFGRCLAIVLRELSECRYWLRFVASRAWIPATRLDPLGEEARQLKAVLGAILVRTRRHDESSG